MQLKFQKTERYACSRRHWYTSTTELEYLPKNRTVEK